MLTSKVWHETITGRRESKVAAFGCRAVWVFCVSRLAGTAYARTPRA